MVAAVVEALSSIFSDTLAYLPPGLILSVAAAFVGDGKYFKAYRDEFIGSILMVCFTFSAGKWVGQNNVYAAWAFHSVGVIAADYFGGGQQVNPAVTMSMWALGKVSYTEAFVRVAGQMGGGLIAFPLFHATSEAMKWTAFGGPEFTMKGDHPVEAALSEFVAMFLLMWAIYIVSTCPWTPFG
jgi:glycerol uptake facilitator-like aquaporin